MQREQHKVLGSLSTHQVQGRDGVSVHHTEVIAHSGVLEAWGVLPSLPDAAEFLHPIYVGGIGNRKTTNLNMPLSLAKYN